MIEKNLPNVDNASVSPMGLQAPHLLRQQHVPPRGRHHQRRLSGVAAQGRHQRRLRGSVLGWCCLKGGGTREAWNSMKHMKFLQTAGNLSSCKIGFSRIFCCTDTYYVLLQPSATSIYIFLKVGQSNSHNSSSQLPGRPSIIDLTNTLFEHDRCDRNKNVFQG